MHVERQLGNPPDRLDNRHANTEVRDKMAVHHVEMQCRHARGFHRPHFTLQMREIASQQRREHPRTGCAKLRL